jgi:hypothetical protein
MMEQLRDANALNQLLEVMSKSVDSETVAAISIIVGNYFSFSVSRAFVLCWKVKQPQMNALDLFAVATR